MNQDIDILASHMDWLSLFYIVTTTLDSQLEYTKLLVI